MTRPRQRPTLMVTGAAGELARQVIRRLHPDYEIVGVDFRRKIDLGPGVQSFCVDINRRDFEDLFRRFRFEGILHLGRIIATEENRQQRYASNVLGTEHLFRLAEKYGVRQMLVLSTYHVYGANPWNPALIDETAPLKAAQLTMDLIDSVELENLAQIWLWKCPELKTLILRPCNIIGPGVRNTISRLLAAKRVPVLAGFSPMMQFLHVEDVAQAINLAVRRPRTGIFNLAPEDWVAWQAALEACGCQRFSIPSVPPALGRLAIRLYGGRRFPPYMTNYFKYPVVLDGRQFAESFHYRPRHGYRAMFRYYQALSS